MEGRTEEKQCGRAVELRRKSCLAGRGASLEGEEGSRYQE